MCRVVQSKNNNRSANVCLLAVSKRKRKKIHVFELPKRSRTRREEWRCWPTLASLSYATSSANKGLHPCKCPAQFWVQAAHRNALCGFLEHLMAYHRDEIRLLDLGMAACGGYINPFSRDQGLLSPLSLPRTEIQNPDRHMLCFAGLRCLKKDTKPSMFRAALLKVMSNSNHDLVRPLKASTYYERFSFLRASKSQGSLPV